MISLHDGQITDLLENSMKHNPETIAIGYAIREEKRRIMLQADKTRLLSVIENMDEQRLDTLAVELRTPAYRDTYPIEIKKALVGGTLVFYAHLGTPAAVENIIRTIFTGGNISEWFEYDGEPHHFSVDIAYMGEAITPVSMGELRRMINSIKRLSSWLDEITITSEIEAAPVYITPVPGRGIEITTLPELEPDWPEKPIYITPVQGRGMSETTLPMLEPDIGTAQITARASPTVHAISETRLPTLEDFDTLVPVIGIGRAGAHFSSITETRLPALKEE